MFYHLSEYLASRIDFPGAGLFQYLSFRSVLAVVTGLCIALIFGRPLIHLLQRKQMGEVIRDLGLEGQLQKKGTPTMGGLLIGLSILVPVLLFCDLGNIYVQLMVVTALWLCAMGFLDDWLKFKRKNKDGLRGVYKLAGQFGLGCIIATCLYYSPDVTLHEYRDPARRTEAVAEQNLNAQAQAQTQTEAEVLINRKSTKTTIPFIKNNELDYAWLAGGNQTLGWLLYLAMIVLVVMALSNGANLTDGMDGLLTGVSLTVVCALGILAYLSGNIIYAKYLNIMYIPNSGEIAVFLAAMVGALIGFLWFNTYPASVFMGDTGSLMIGGLIGVAAIVIRKELLLPLLCGIFLVESLSVMVQRAWFKYTKKRYGQGRRIFKMTPLHHHFQKDAGVVQAWIQAPQRATAEAKIVVRFCIISVILAVITIVTLKMR